MVKARIYARADRHSDIYIQRAKYKHWFPLGYHKATDNAFRDALAQNTIEWKLIERRPYEPKLIY